MGDLSGEFRKIFDKYATSTNLTSEELLNNLRLNVKKYHAMNFCNNVIFNLKQGGSTNDRFKW